MHEVIVKMVFANVMQVIIILKTKDMKENFARRELVPINVL
jgi:hypothetical protein